MKPHEIADEVARKLAGLTVIKRPRAALAAFAASIALGEVDRQAAGRVIELTRLYRPRVAAAAVQALMRAKRAREKATKQRS